MRDRQSRVKDASVTWLNSFVHQKTGDFVHLWTDISFMWVNQCFFAGKYLNHKNYKKSRLWQSDSEQILILNILRTTIFSADTKSRCRLTWHQKQYHWSTPQKYWKKTVTNKNFLPKKCIWYIYLNFLFFIFSIK